ncbi:MAG TPA: hypothetical protein VIS48_06495 [Candidatus Kryptonia bacterium]
MSKVSIALAFAACVSTSDAFCQKLYFQRGSTILEWMPGSNSPLTIWSAPFDIFDVSIGHDGKYICFTRWEDSVSNDKEIHDPRRQVGMYSVEERKISIIPSASHYNYGAVMSPDTRVVAFNCLHRPGDWETAIYDRSTKRVVYDIDRSSVYAWNSDSTIMSTTPDGISEIRITDRSTKRYQLPDTSMMDISVPGTEMIRVSDSVSVFVCEDMVVSNPDFDGPIQNVFVTRNHDTSRILGGIVDVTACYFREGYLYVDFADYNQEKNGKHRLLKYDMSTGRHDDLDPIGTLVGVGGN